MRPLETGNSRGRISFTLYVSCPACLNVRDFPDAANRRDLAATIRRRGWRNTREHGWLCPACIHAAKCPECTAERECGDAWTLRRDMG